MLTELLKSSYFALFLIVALGLFAMIQRGDGNLVLGSALVMWGFIAALIGGGGSIILIIFDN